jgi:hypothetical protein
MHFCLCAQVRGDLGLRLAQRASKVSQGHLLSAKIRGSRLNLPTPCGGQVSELFIEWTSHIYS